MNFVKNNKSADQKYYDLCIASDWTYDEDFIAILEDCARQRSLSTYIVRLHNLDETFFLINENQLHFRYFFDRASDTSPEFIKLQHFFSKQNLPVFETKKQLKWASDKATMHLEFISNGLNLPYTIILPSYRETADIKLSLTDLAYLGRPFIIKPANTTGGGIGVVNGAETLQDVIAARLEFEYDKYLLQEKIIPANRDEKRFWFRCFYACGDIYLCWWNDINHRYDIMSQDDEEKYNLRTMYAIVEKIAEICKLNLFSTEITMNNDEKFIIVDYVNESCDMRLQSSHYDGVPDLVVHQIAERIIQFIGNILAS
ncbi:MAG: RimK family alpha-L-glutamate ligase [Calditrichaceae bacterium]